MKIIKSRLIKTKKEEQEFAKMIHDKYPDEEILILLDGSIQPDWMFYDIPTLSKQTALSIIGKWAKKTLKTYEYAEQALQMIKEGKL